MTVNHHNLGWLYLAFICINMIIISLHGPAFYNYLSYTVNGTVVDKRQQLLLGLQNDCTLVMVKLTSLTVDKAQITLV